MTLGDFRKATKDLPDDMLILYAWTWRCPRDLSVGAYMGAIGHDHLLLDGNQGDWAKGFKNKVLYEGNE